MKTKKLIIPIVILVGLIVYLFVSSEESSKNDKPFSEFSFEDTASIDKIIISNTLGSSISIQRRNENGTWKINNTETRANKEGITRILSTFHQWKVIQNIDEKDLNSTNKQLAIKHHKIEVFTNGSDKSTRTYYVGDANQSMTGNLGF